MYECFRPSVGGDLISLVIQNFPLISSTTSITVTFDVNSQIFQSSDIGLTFSNTQETSLTIVTPFADLGEASSLIASVTIIPTQDIRKTVIFNYTFFAVLPSVEFFSPSTGKDTGGDLIWVNIKYFQYPAGIILVQIGDVITTSTTSDTSSQSSTLISFFTPPGLSLGPTLIQVYPNNCTQPCKMLVSFGFYIKSAKDLILASPIPTSASYQQLAAAKMFPPIQIQNVEYAMIVRTESIVGTISSQHVGFVETACSKWSTLDNITFSIWLNYPSNLRTADMLTLCLTVRGVQNRTVCISFELFDGRQTRIVSVMPMAVPVVAIVGGKVLNFHSKSTLIFSNLFPQSVSIYVSSNESSTPADVLDVKLVSSCTTNADCNRTSITISLPALVEQGSKNLILSTASRNFSFGQVFQYSLGCDYDSLCGFSQVPDLKAIIASPALACDSTLCIDSTAFDDRNVGISIKRVSGWRDSSRSVAAKSALI